MPALMTTIVLTIVGFWFLYSPHDFEQLLRSGIASILSVSNIYFYFDADYFSSDAIYKPLLHTWSLGVEEQFYLVWPIAMIALAKRRGRLSPALLIVIVLLGLAAALWCAYENPDLAFYLSPFRIYQFMLGALAAVVVARLGDAPKFVGPLSTIFSWLAIPVMTALSLATYGLGLEQTIAQGCMAVVVAMACGLFDLAERKPTAISPLKLAPIVFIGTRSYAIYLAHWPVILAFIATHKNGHELPVQLAVVAFAVSLVAGIALSQFVERPIRLVSNDAPVFRGFKLGTTAGFVAASLLATVFAFALVTTKGVTAAALASTSNAPNASSVAPAAITLEDIQQKRSDAGSPKECTINLRNEKTSFDQLTKCLPPGGRSVLIVGDSYSHDLYMVLHGRKPDLNYALLVIDGCPPYFGDDAETKAQMSRQLAACQVWQQDPWAVAKTWIADLPVQPDIVLTGNWNYMGGREGFLEANVAWLAGLPNRTAIVGNRPTFSEEVWRLASTGQIDSDKANSLIPFIRQTGYGSNQVAITQKLDKIARMHPNLTYFAVYQELCSQPQCPAFANGKLLYMDKHHFTADGANWLASKGVFDRFLGSKAPAPGSARPGSTALGSKVVVSLACGAAYTNGEGFRREITLAGGNGVYTSLRGAKDTERYELWEMKLDGGNGFTVTGEYIEGGPELKPLSFTGTVVGAVVSGEGMRGTRKCTIKS